MQCYACHGLSYHSPPPPPLGLRQFRLALVQLAVGADKAANLQRASRMVREAAENGAQVVALPVSGGPGTLLSLGSYEYLHPSFLPRNVSTLPMVPSTLPSMQSQSPATPPRSWPVLPRSARSTSLGVPMPP